MNDTQALLKRFCMSGIHAGALSEPFRLDGFLYATNGYMAIRVPDDPMVKIGNYDATTIGKIKSLLLAHPGETEFMQPIPDSVFDGAGECEICHGTVKLAKCPSCEGGGEFEHFENYYKCKPCDGSGFVAPDEFIEEEHVEFKACHICQGSKLSRRFVAYVGKTQLGALNAKLIQSLPGHKISINPDSVQEYIYFVFDGGIGVVRQHMTLDQVREREKYIGDAQYDSHKKNAEIMKKNARTQAAAKVKGGAACQQERAA